MYPITTSVLELLPTLNISNIKSAYFTLLLTNAVLKTIVSTKTSLAPFKDFSFYGSHILRTG